MAMHESRLSRILGEFTAQSYESEFTRFMRELKRQRPQLEAEQRKSRAIWWDHMQDLDELKREKESRVKQQAYVYQSKV
jgi:Skp family chaperone for outer membrane proteins